MFLHRSALHPRGVRAPRSRAPYCATVLTHTVKYSTQRRQAQFNALLVILAGHTMQTTCGVANLYYTVGVPLCMPCLSNVTVMDDVKCHDNCGVGAGLQLLPVTSRYIVHSFSHLTWNQSGRHQ